jgi:hypothetical protein
MTQTVKPLYSQNPVPLPNITVTHGFSPSRIYQHTNVCLLDEVRMVQPLENDYMPGQGWNDFYGNGTPNPYY